MSVVSRVHTILLVLNISERKHCSSPVVLVRGFDVIATAIAVVLLRLPNWGGPRFALHTSTTHTVACSSQPGGALAPKPLDAKKTTHE